MHHVQYCCQDLSLQSNFLILIQQIARLEVGFFGRL